LGSQQDALTDWGVIIACGQEIAQQNRHGAPAFDTIAITAFSGGSQAGLLMATQLAGLAGEIVSIPIAWEGGRVRAYVTEVIERAMGEVHYRADTHAAFFVTMRCLSDLQPALKKNLLGDWFVAIVVAARCDGGYEPRMAAAAQVAIGSASRVRITFDDRSTHAILKVEPLP